MSCFLSIYFVLKILELLDPQSGQAQSQAMVGLASSSSSHNQFPGHHHSGLSVAASHSAAAAAPTQVAPAPEKASSAAAATALLNLPGITIQPQAAAQRTEPEAPPANATPGGGGVTIKTERGEVADMPQIASNPVRTGCLIIILT